jgi:hypothetical protein
LAPSAAYLSRAVTVHRARIDELIGEYAEGWTLDRMPAVDRNVLRIGIYELLWADDIPDGVAISEAVLLARDLSTDASPAFINGLLARIAELKPSLKLESPLGLEPSPEPPPDLAPSLEPGSSPELEAADRRELAGNPPLFPAQPRNPDSSAVIDDPSWH